MTSKCTVAGMAILGGILAACFASAQTSPLTATVERYQMGGSLRTVHQLDVNAAAGADVQAGELYLPSLSESVLSVYRNSAGDLQRAFLTGVASDEQSGPAVAYELSFEVVRLLEDGAVLALDSRSWIGQSDAAAGRNAPGGGEYRLSLMGDRGVSLRASAEGGMAGAVRQSGWVADGVWIANDDSPYLLLDTAGALLADATLWFELGTEASDLVGTLPGDGPNGEGNAFLYQATDSASGEVVDMQARAYGHLSFTGDLTIAKITEFVGGLGACNLNESECGGPNHALDAETSQDYQLMQFSQPIEFLSLSVGWERNNFPADVRWWVGTAPDGLDLTGINPANVESLLEDVTTGDDFGDFRRTFDISGTGNVLFLTPLTVELPSYVKILSVHGAMPMLEVCVDFDLDDVSDGFVGETPGNPFGNILRFVETDNVTGQQVFLDLRGYGGSQNSGLHENALAARMVSGTGVCNAMEGADCTGDDAFADNTGDKDVLVAVFDQLVEFSDFQIGATGPDDGDVQWWVGTGPADYSLEGIGISDSNIANSLADVTSGESDFETPRVVALSGTGNVLVIRPDLEETNDAIKLLDVRGCVVPGGPQPGAIGDKVWKDFNSDGQQDDDEPGVSGIVVNLWTDEDADGAPDTQVATTVTDAGGMYLFTGLDTSLTYIVQFINDPAMNMPFTTPNTGPDDGDSDADPDSGLSPPINLSPGETNTSIDAGLVNLTSGLGDKVWKDTNRDGVQGPDEPGVAGITVNLWTDEDGDGIADTQIDSTQTDGDGMYAFNGLDPALTYVVQFVNDPAMGMPFTARDVGDDASDSDADRVTGFTGPITLAPGTFDDSIDAGLMNLPAGLGNRIWKDLNNDGLQDASEPGVVGITVNLWTDDDGDGNPDTLLDTTISKAGGTYFFIGLDASLTYIVEFVNDPAMNMPFTTPNAGAEALDSDADPISGLTGPIDLAPGEFNGDIDAGLINIDPPELASLGDKVWKDLDGDGVQGAGEPGVSGITVNLWTDDDGDGTPDTQIGSTVTDADGMYGFSDLDPALTYIVEFVNDPAMNMPFTLPNAGPDDTDSDVDPDSGLSPPINLAPGENNLTVDAGLINGPGNVDAALGNFVWIDVNLDGIQDPDEPVVQGMRVRLWIDTDGDGEPDTNVRTTNTDGQGMYRFDFLDPGVPYWVQFEITNPDLVFTLQDAGPDDVDSDADPVTGFTGAIVLGSGEFNPTIDAGVFKPDP